MKMGRDSSLKRLRTNEAEGLFWEQDQGIEGRELKVRGVLRSQALPLYFYEE